MIPKTNLFTSDYSGGWRTIILNIDGDPVQQKRHRTVRVGAFMREYDPSKELKKDFLSVLHHSIPEVTPRGSIHLHLVFTFLRPKSHLTSKMQLKKGESFSMIKKPDIDNLIKFVMDALNGKYWHDDSQISHIIAEKEYSVSKASTRIEITYSIDA